MTHSSTAKADAKQAQDEKIWYQKKQHKADSKYWQLQVIYLFLKELSGNNLSFIKTV